MKNYTEQDYKDVYARLEREEQESIKAYNNWLMQVKITVKTYNNTILNHGLEGTFKLLKAETDEDIELLDLEYVKEQYDLLLQTKSSLAHNIEIALGLKEGTAIPLETGVNLPKSSETTQADDDDFFGEMGSFDLEEDYSQNPLE